MRRLHLILLLLLLTAANGRTETLELYGYGEFNNLLQTVDESELTTETKLRLDLLSVSDDGAFTFGANLNFLLYHGETSWNILDYLPEELTKQLPADEYDSYAETYQDQYQLDNCWLRMRWRAFDLTLGRQQLAFGGGYAWNPTDLFNPLNLMDVTYEKPGVQAGRLDLTTDRVGTFTLVATPAADLASATTLLQWQQQIQLFELNLLVARSPWRFTDYATGPPVTTELKRNLYGGSLVGQIWELGVWGEYAYHDLQEDNLHEDFSELVLGSDYTFRNGFYLLSEFFWNGAGRGSSEDYTLTDWMRMYSGETLSLARSQFYLYGMYPATDLISVGLTTLYSPSDGGAGLLPTLNYSPQEETEITMITQLYAGGDLDQFSQELGLLVLLRLRHFF